MKRIKKNDKVIVTTGKSKGHVGVVLSVSEDKAVVEGANIIKKHVRPNPQLNQTGGVVSKEAAIHISNLAHYNPETKKAGKVGFKHVEQDGKKYKVRYFKSNDALIDVIK